MKAPLISVVLPVYKNEKYVGEAIQSILNQSFSNFELIVVDDRSPDNTVGVIQLFKDPRIRLFINPINLGRAGSDNFAISQIQGQYVAKMDSDDICHPERLARQVNYLENHPEINVVGSWMQNFGHDSYLNKYPETADSARAMTLFTLPVGNPSVMLRSNLFLQQGMRYDQSLRQTEDFDFFARYAAELAVVTLPEALIQYRTYPNTVKQDILSERHQVANAVREKILVNWGISASKRELNIHHLVTHLDAPLQTITLQEINAWLLKLAAFNLANPLYDQLALVQQLAFRWFQACYTYPQPKFGSIKQYYRSELSAHFNLSKLLKMKLFYKSIRGF